MSRKKTATSPVERQSCKSPVTGGPGDVAYPLQVPDAERDVESEKICSTTGFNRGNDHDVPLQRANVVVDENWLALRYSQGE